MMKVSLAVNAESMMKELRWGYAPGTRKAST